MDAQTGTQRNRTWVQLQHTLQSRSYPDDPYVALAVDVFVSAVTRYKKPVDAGDPFGISRHDEALNFLRDLKSPFHQLLELDEEFIENLLTRIQKDTPCKNGYRRPMSRMAKAASSGGHGLSSCSSASTSGATSSTPLAR